MKKIGIVGGVAWPSTVDYYAEICRRSEQWNAAAGVSGVASTPEMSIESLDIVKAFSFLGTDGDEESWSRFDEYHRAALRRLEASGAEFAIMASNTPHHRLRAILRGVGIPVIGIFEAAAKESARIGATEVLILGTSVTMNSQALRDEFSKQGVEAACPEDENARARTAALIGELQGGKPRDAPERLEDIARTSFQRRFSGPPVVSLACTELPLAFPRLKTLPVFEVNGIRYINTAMVHVSAALEYARGNVSAGTIP